MSSSWSPTYRHHKALEAALRPLIRRRCAKVHITCALITLVLIALSLALPGGELWGAPLPLSSGGWMLWYSRAKNRALTSAIQRQLCSRCGYCTFGIPRANRGHLICPECGGDVDLQILHSPAPGYLGGSVDGYLASSSEVPRDESV